jgi:hypothetical protein
MSFIRRQPRDVTEQLLQFAEAGRLTMLTGRDSVAPSHRNHFAILIAVGAVLSAAFGAVFALTVSTTHGSTALIVGLSLSGLIGLGLLIAAASSIRDRTTRHNAVSVKPGAVLPPDLLKVGNWIRRGDAWVRVDEVGRDGGGHINALLSTGEVVKLDTPVTIAGGAFRAVPDPVASLRR